MCASFGPSRAGQAACFLLHTLWNLTDLHQLYRKVSFLIFHISESL